MNTDLQAAVFQKLSKFFELERVWELWKAIDHAGTVEEIISRALEHAYQENARACHPEDDPPAEAQKSPEAKTAPPPGLKPESARGRARQQYTGSATDHQSKRQQREDEEDAAEPDWENDVDEISIDKLRSFDRNNDPDSVLGNRWLCRGDTAVIQGETGIGKSTLVMQAIIWWAMAELFFGIKAKHALKSLLIQSENNEGDLAEVFQDVVKAMGLGEDQIEYLKTKIVIVKESSKTGQEFLKLARRLIKKHQPDLVFADPFLSYLGDSASDQKAMSAFLRNGLQPIVQASKVIWFWIHHFSKPPRVDQPATRRSIYSGFGSVELPGWARETITVNSVNDDDHLCEITFGKRARRVGLSDDQGNPIYKICIQQSKNGVLWESADQIESTSRTAAQYGKVVKEISAFIERKVNVTHPQLEKFGKQLDVGQKKSISIARALVDDEGEPRIYEYRIKGRTFGSLAFSTVPKDLNPLAFVRPKRTRSHRKKEPKKAAG
jgi:ABC-type dipeptide/oligopeptide/nickel transport system ATPase subunit